MTQHSPAEIFDALGFAVLEPHQGEDLRLEGARLAVRTQVCRFSEPIVREAILREMRRGGQVYFVHNRVRGIRMLADRIQRLVPEMRQPSPSRHPPRRAVRPLTLRAAVDKPQADGAASWGHSAVGTSRFGASIWDSRMSMAATPPTTSPVSANAYRLVSSMGTLLRLTASGSMLVPISMACMATTTSRVGTMASTRLDSWAPGEEVRVSSVSHTVNRGWPAEARQAMVNRSRAEARGPLR